MEIIYANGSVVMGPELPRYWRDGQMVSWKSKLFLVGGYANEGGILELGEAQSMIHCSLMLFCIFKNIEIIKYLRHEAKKNGFFKVYIHPVDSLFVNVVLHF